MNKTKRALISMAVTSSIFCITIFFNIQLPIPILKSTKADATVIANSRTVAAKTEEGAANTYSYRLDQAEIFNMNQYLASYDEQLYQNYEASQEENSDAGNAQTDAAFSAILTQGAEESNTTNEDQAQAIVTPAAQTLTADIQGSDPEPTAAATEEPAQVKEEPKSQYADIGISVAKEYVNIRKKPSTDSSSLGKLYRGSACTILSEEDGWYYVESGSVKGYAKAEYIKTGIPDKELIDKYGIQKISVDVDGLNVRKEPSTESKKLTVIYQNEKYPVLEVNGDWIKIHIEDENLDGYVKSELVDLIVTFEDAVSKEEEEKILQLQAEERAKKETAVKYGDGFTYTNEDLKLLACLIHAEAGTQSYEGKLAVANIVLNRVKSSKYPDSIRAVIYQNGQFSVAASGSLEKQLNNFDHYDSKSQKLSVKAAKDALEGANNVGKRLYFHTYKAAANKGYNDNEKSVKIGDHLFW